MKAMTGILAATALLATGALLGQAVNPEESLRAEILSVDEQDRTITVRLRDDDMPTTFAFEDDAGVYTWDGRLSRPQNFDDLRAGMNVLLEFGGVEGSPTVRKVTMEQEDEISESER
jgi:hypothetical protein